MKIHDIFYIFLIKLYAKVLKYSTINVLHFLKGGVEMPKFCAFSNRIYKNKLDENTVNEITDTLSVCNKIKAKAYKLSYNSKYKKHKYEKSIQLLLKDEFNVTSDYYVNSARKEADATLSSQSEKLKLDIDNLKNQIKVREKKIKDTEKTLENKLKVKQSLIKISKVIKENK